MLPEKYAWIGVQFEPEGDPWGLYGVAVELEQQGQLEAAATVYDRAFGLDPSADRIRQARARLLERLAIEEHGLVFRYVPGGVFLMGREGGEADEGPWHPVWLRPFWITETPLSWAAYCRIMGWSPPPVGLPEDRPSPPPGGFDRVLLRIDGHNRLRLQYCEDHTTGARDWHAHIPPALYQFWGNDPSARDRWDYPPRTDPAADWEYQTKPMIAVSWDYATLPCERMSTDVLHYTLPTEAQWEKAARGGLIGARYAWGNEPPTHDHCDFDRFDELSILPSRTFAANGYGLYGMCGGVWEWTADWYDRDYYRTGSERDPTGPAEGEEKVLRGGCWADCADVVGVSYRMALPPNAGYTPNVGFRLCRAPRVSQ